MDSFQSVLERVGRILSDRYGIRVVCQGNQCCTDGNTIYLPALPAEVPEDLLGAIRAFLDHEVSHLVGKTDFDLGRRFKKRHGESAFAILNVLEDLRTEKALKQVYAGCGANLKAGYDYAVGQMGMDPDGLHPLRQVLSAMYSRGCRRPDIPFLNPQAYTITDQIKAHVQGAVSAKDTKAVARLALEAWAVIQHLLPSMEDKRQPPESDPGGSGSPPEEEGQNNIGNEQTGAQQSQGSTQAPAPQSADAGTAATATGTQVSAADNVSPMGDLSRWITAALQGESASTKPYRVWTTEFDTIQTAAPAPGFDYRALLTEVLPCVGGVRQRLLQSLMAETESRWLGDQEAGSLAPRALHRLVCGTGDRVFRRKVQADRQNTAILFLIDQSHSMRGSKIDLARKTAVVFCEALDRLHLPTAVVGFSTGQSELVSEVSRETGIPTEQLAAEYRFAPLHHVIYKGFDESLRDVAGRFGSMTPDTLTPLGESLLLGAKLLGSRPEQRKVIFCLTDGKPVVGITAEGITSAHAKDSIRRIERSGIEVVLVGILEECVRNLHQKHVVVRNLADLPRTVIRELESILTRRYRHAAA